MGLLLYIFCCVFCLTRANVEQQATDNTDNRATLEDEMDNQENILTQLIGDYDKVKTLSEGSDCQCKCVVRPLSRSACKRIEEGQAKTEDFYTVETVTAGPNCKKCACIAPPSALNPCEGDFRFKKLQEAGQDDIKLSNIMDLLEGSFYGMDLLKLHSVTTKLLERVDNIEKSFSGNLTKEKVSVKGEKGQGKGARSNQRQEKKKRLSVLEPSLQKNAAAAFAHTERKYEEKFVGNQGPSKPVLKKSKSEGQEEQHKPAKTKADAKNMSLRSMTFYKANRMEDSEGEERIGATVAHEVVSGDESVDLIIEDQLHKQGLNTPVTTPEATVTVTQSTTINLNTQNFTTARMSNVTKQTQGQSVKAMMSSTITTERPTMPTSTTSTSTMTPGTNTTTIATPLVVPKQLASVTVPIKKSKLSWDEVTTQKSTTTLKTKDHGICKDTLASISDPVTHNKYGKNEGAWMKDPKGNGKVVYVTDYYYGNQLLEFRDIDTFKQGQVSNSYKLPYNWIGTGHVVYSGSFFYNRAFSRDIIRFDLRLRYVAAWTTLHDAILEEEEAPWTWGGHSDIDFSVDESGLWLVYPALDDEGFHQEVIILSKLRASDLQKEKSWRTGLRRNYYGNCFVICGVLYAVDSFERTHANISYAFDTHTHTQMIPRLPFINNYTYTTQIDYNPKERMLYAWDNGHQVTYDVIFAY
ncbi:olfactomedin-like protein 2B isoform X2 [Danio rerio]|uniref:Olfactomedin-like protein 2B isoform X2 n=1 Tax=Danio rerio TaxID=7955 RepID=A0A8N7UVJ6_DANRE|nr:olfactomedin-like protein 2B isoform X1 [Danio rerio]|eukprot:XP_696310.4 olfactomedin-like protein 2B isoform X1 [Danio rerio]